MTHSLPFGTVVKIAFPFTDLAVTKSAPAVVVSSERYHYERADVVLVRVSSKTEKLRDRFGVVEIPDPADCGLTLPSVIKPVLVTVARDRIFQVLGQLDVGTAAHLRSALREILGPLS